jgi:AcrR family transcriptional regulator
MLCSDRRWQNKILVMQNAIPSPAQQRLAERGAQYSDEVRRLLDAGLAVMRRCGTTSRPRVADIVAEAGLSNDAFYRHFHSKEAIVAAILDDGSARLASYLSHQMAKAPRPEDKVRRWAEGVMSQAADAEIAASTLAVMWNGATVGGSLGTARPSTTVPLAKLLEEPFAAGGSNDPAGDAALCAHAVVGRLSDYLWAERKPTRAEIAHVTEFCLRVITAA